MRCGGRGTRCPWGRDLESKREREREREVGAARPSCHLQFIVLHVVGVKARCCFLGPGIELTMCRTRRRSTEHATALDATGSSCASAWRRGRRHAAVERVCCGREITTVSRSYNKIYVSLWLAVFWGAGASAHAPPGGPVRVTVYCTELPTYRSVHFPRVSLSPARARLELYTTSTAPACSRSL